MPVIRLILLIVILTATVSGQNWPSFRGPQASGVADGRNLPVRWDAATSTNILWKSEIPGLAHSSPVVWGDRIFLTTAISSTPNPAYAAKDRGIGLVDDDVKHTWRVYCLDKRTGRMLWEQTAHEGIPRTKRHLKATQANPTPVTDGRYVVALMNSEGLFAYDVAGKFLWKVDLGILNPGLYEDKTSEWGQASSPVIFRDRVIVQSDGHKQSFIAAFRLSDGKQIWRVERGEITSWSTPTIYEGKSRVEMIVNGGHYIRGYDPLTGRELWRFFDGNTEVKQQAPLIAGDKVLVTGGYPLGRPMYAFRLGASGDISVKDGESNAHLVWRTPKGSPYTTTPIVYGDYFYVCADNGVLSAYKVNTGEQVYQQRLASSFSASPVAGDGKLYFPSEDGEVFVVRAGPKFELLSTNPMGEALMASPAISDGVLIIRSQKFVYAVQERTRKARK